MRFGIVHVHIEALSRGVDLVVELVRPGTDDLLKIVVAEFAVVKGVVAGVNGIVLVGRYPLDHDGAGGLITRISLPERDVGAVGNAGLNRPLIVKLSGRKNSRLGIVVESVDERVAGHEVIPRQLPLDVRLGNDATDSDVYSTKVQR